MEDLNNIVEDENNLNPEENSEHFLAIIIECLALLSQIPEAIEVSFSHNIYKKRKKLCVYIYIILSNFQFQVIKTQMQNELLRIIEYASKNIKVSPERQTAVNIKVQDASASNVESPSQSPLLELLNVIFERFQQVIASHSLALCGFAHVIKKHNLEVPLYEMTDVWNSIQAVVN